MNATRSSVSSPRTVASESYLHVRLPKLNLPVFSGKYDEWFPFHDLFNSIIHGNASLSDVQRLQYLRASLSGDALSIISALEISDQNYAVAWNTLRERYDNKRVVVSTHIKAILELPDMIKENVSELRQISYGVVKHLPALKALRKPVDTWDDLLIHILSSKLDPLTLREWQDTQRSTELPTLKQFTDFIVQRSQTLEASVKSNVNPTNRVSARLQGLHNTKRQASHVATSKFKCAYCDKEHAIYSCKGFLALSVARRIAETRKRDLCLNCLKSGHVAEYCQSGNCRTCGLRHNTLLHRPKARDEHNSDSDENKDRVSSGTPAQNQQTIATHSSCYRSANQVFLSTASVYAHDRYGKRIACRALLDCGSQANFITSKLLHSLRVNGHSANITVFGINNSSHSSNQTAHVKIQSRINAFSTTLECIVTEQITGKVSSMSLSRKSVSIPANLELADPLFNVSADIDILLGADVFWQLMSIGQVKASSKHPTLQKTRLGWILAGRTMTTLGPSRGVHALCTTLNNHELHDQLRQFWQLEEVNQPQKYYTTDEQICEAHFTRYVSNDPLGRYVVKLPVKENILSRIGDSRQIALKRFYQLEKRLNREPKLKNQYSQFIQEYLRLGHMRIVSANRNDSGISFYLPHHAVFKNSSQTTRLRVVFDGPCKSTTGISLNDALMVGPNVQHDLVSILMRFRTFAYVFTADIVKMYRQVLVHESQVSLQHILWHDNPQDFLNTYELLTVTYGTSSASFLATRCIKHLANKYGSEFPSGSKCINRDFYVNDLLTGADTIVEIKQLREEVEALLNRGQFQLNKWQSNCPELMDINAEANAHSLPVNSESGSKILGVRWDPITDSFYFTYENDSVADRITKRVLLSQIASIFDPLGLLGPLVIVAKILLQDTWQSGVDWDESLPQDLHDRWLEFKNQLPQLSEMSTPRRVKFTSEQHQVQFHGFCDASQRAYGACVYIRSRMSSGQVRVELLCSKSRVTPIKAVTLPRLELCAATLLSRLIETIRFSIDLSKTSIFLWSDSTIVLHWISSSSRKWPIFVANRVGEVQRLTSDCTWRHVSSLANPADVISRGASLRDLAPSSSIWWNGPAFLSREEESWPSRVSFEESPQSMHRDATSMVSKSDNLFMTACLRRYSSLDKVIRVLSYCLRFSFPRNNFHGKFISHEEMTQTMTIICREIQRETFPEDYRRLSSKQPLNNTSRVLSLTPFLDKDGVIRVGGRLVNSQLPYAACHPILLPRAHSH